MNLHTRFTKLIGYWWSMLSPKVTLEWCPKDDGVELVLKGEMVHTMSGPCWNSA